MELTFSNWLMSPYFGSLDDEEEACTATVAVGDDDGRDEAIAYVPAPTATARSRALLVVQEKPCDA